MEASLGGIELKLRIFIIPVLWIRIKCLSDHWIRVPLPVWPLDPDPVSFWPLDPESGVFLTPGYGIIPDLESPTHIFESLVTIFWVKITTILYSYFFLYMFNKLWQQKKVRQAYFFPSFSVAVVGSEIRNPRWIKNRIRNKHPGSATLNKCWSKFEKMWNIIYLQNPDSQQTIIRIRIQQKTSFRCLNSIREEILHAYIEQMPVLFRSRWILT